MKTSFIQFLLIFSVLSLLFFPQTSVQGAKNGLILWSATITPTLLPFFTCFTGFMQYYQTLPSDLPALLPLKKLFPGINEDVFLHLYSRFFLWYVPSVRRSLMILFLVDLLRNLKEKSYYIPAIRSVPCSLLDILLH